MTIVCGDSHTATHGAFGALAHGIGTSEVEHVLATQTLIQRKSQEHEGRDHRQAARRASPPRTSPCRSSARPAPPAAPAMSSNIAARRSAICQHGRPHDRLQHGDRRRRARRPDRAGREDLRLCHGPPARAERRAVGSGDELVEDAAFRRRRPLGQGRDHQGRGHRAGRHLGHLARGRAADHRRACPPPDSFSRAARSMPPGGRWNTWA